jgi:hypothetical protein
MKFLAAALVFFSITVFGQDVNVPKQVSDAFTKLYPKVTNVKWDKEGKNEYEAGFKYEGKDMTVVFDKNGMPGETETVIQISELPNAVAPYIAKKYPGYKITEADKISDAKGKTLYEAEISKDKIHKDVLFDKAGKPVKK